MFENVKTRGFKLVGDKEEKFFIFEKEKRKFQAAVESALVVLIYAPFGRDAECIFYHVEVNMLDCTSIIFPCANYSCGNIDQCHLSLSDQLWGHKLKIKFCISLKSNKVFRVVLFVTASERL